LTADEQWLIARRVDLERQAALSAVISIHLLPSYRYRIDLDALIHTRPLARALVYERNERHVLLPERPFASLSWRFEPISVQFTKLKAHPLLSITLTVLPVFALIFTGWAARKLGVLGSNATVELNRFVVYLALPALLFDIVMHSQRDAVWQPGFITAFGLSSLLVFALTVAIVRHRHGNLANAAIDGLNASYPNTGFMGFPLILAIFGGSSLPLALIASLFTVCILFAIAIVLIEISRQSAGNPRQLVVKVAASLLKNPIILAPALASVVRITYGSLPTPVDVFFKYLSATASPCALIALGLFLAEERRVQESNVNAAATVLATMKLIVHPAIAWSIAHALRLPPVTAGATLLLAALPTGTGPFMLAEMYKCDAAITARTILITTVVSILTIAIYLRAT
jgi:malonate transporter and related proteins